MPAHNAFKPPRPRNTQNPGISLFNKNVSSGDMSSLKSTVESNFPGVALNYEGSEFDYSCTLEGPKDAFSKAINFLFPKGRDDITIQLSTIA